jgi:glycosyltransferase involved in cell wall biosynthesis
VEFGRWVGTDDSVLEKKVAIIHHTLSSLGGGERVGASTVEALNRVGLVPDVYTTSPLNISYLQNFYGKQIKFKLHPLTPFNVRLLGIYQRLLPSFYSFTLSRYDVVVNTSGIYTPLFLKNLIKQYILYVYNPLVPLQILNIRENLKYQRSLFWKLYFQPYQALIRHSLQKLGDTVLLAVSNFTQLRIRHYWNRESTTVYPPVDINTFSQVYNNTDREGVISIGRFTPEKNHLLQLEIAKQTPDTTFRICGSAKTPYYWRWFSHVKAEAEEMDLQNVEFYPNIPFQKLVKLIGESKFFIHTLENEDFGLTTCEAIAGGCIPCVHNSGGQKEVVPYPRLRFNTVNQAVRILNRQFDDSLREALFKHIWQYREERFQKQMLDVILNVNA